MCKSTRNGKSEWMAERDRLFEEQERDLAEADAQGKPIWPPMSEADYVQMLYQEWQERHGLGD
jgi:fructose-specific component phosphotransferase system IIB-like protein